MSALYIALPVALFLAVVGVAAFIWSVRSGQMDDLETPALRIFGEDDERRSDGRANGQPKQDPPPNEQNEDH